MLTERIIRDATPGPKTVILWDRQVRGLGLRVTPKNAKSFVLNYRVGGRERRATLARAGEISLKIAREPRRNWSASGPATTPSRASRKRGKRPQSARRWTGSSRRLFPSASGLER